MISIVSPVYNEAENLIELCQRIIKVIESIKEEFEIILVENGSIDSSLEIIKDLRKKDPRIKYVSLSRNFGHQGGLLAGLFYAHGDAVITMDGDLQHPPELIPEMVSLWKQGHDVVYTTKNELNSDKDWRSIPSKLFYRFLSRISEVNLSYGQSDFRLTDQKVVEVIRKLPEKNIFLRGMVEWLGFNQIGIQYNPPPRKRGHSKFHLRNYINFAFDGVFSFSTIPLRIFLWTGSMIALFCGFYGIYWLVIGLIYLYFPESLQLPPGWATLSVSITFLGSVQLLGIGILGEYLGRTYNQTKQRPDFVVKEKDLQ